MPSVRYVAKVPKWVEQGGWTEGWLKPWTVPLDGRKWPKFKAELRKHGLYSPHFTIAEWKSRPDSCGCPSVPSPCPARTQRLAFKVERVRHRLGDRPIGNWSVYRSRCHNDCTPGAAKRSRHMSGDAIDPKVPAGVSIARFNREFHREFANGGIGTQGTLSGLVRHVDLGPRRRWTY